MKKIFLFAAALVAAMTVNAASFVGFDARDGKFLEIFPDGIKNVENTTFEAGTTSDGKDMYNIYATVKQVESSFEIGGIKFAYTESKDDKKLAWKAYGTYIQANGKKRAIIVPTTAGEKIRVYCPKEMEVGVTGATVSTITFKVWGEDKETYNVLEATGSELTIWSDLRDENFTEKKAQIGAILPDGSQAIGNVADEAKAVKTFENGQLVIIKNGVRYNALGVQL